MIEHCPVGLGQSVMRLHAPHHLADPIRCYAERHPRHVGSGQVRAQRNQGSVQVDELLSGTRRTAQQNPGKARRSINLDDVPDSEKQEMSNWTISLEEEGEIKVGGNSYLHDNVD